MSSIIIQRSSFKERDYFFHFLYALASCTIMHTVRSTVSSEIYRKFLDWICTEILFSAFFAMVPIIYCNTGVRYNTTHPDWRILPGLLFPVQRPIIICNIEKTVLC